MICTSLIKILYEYRTCLIFFILLCSKICVSQESLNIKKDYLIIQAGVETSKEDFSWSIAGNIDGKNPNIYSEIIFDPIRSTGFYLHADYHFFNKISIRTQYNQIFTHQGSVTDFDYAEDNRTNPITQLYLESDKGARRTLGGSVSYDLLQIPSFTIAAGLGFQATKELFYLLDNNNPDLKSTYTAWWKGPAIHTMLRWQAHIPLYIGTQISFHFFEYNAEANWNQIQEFKHPLSFIHTANGNGWDYATNVGYKFNERLGVDVSWLYNNWKTGFGKDMLFLSNGEIPETRMNGAFKKNSSWRLTYTYTF